MTERRKLDQLQPGPLVWPVRGQHDVGLVDVPDVVECTAAEDMCRQEYALQSDLAYQIQRFGVGVHGKSGIVDFDSMDLTAAMSLLEASQKAWLALPKVVRDRYMSWQNVQAAAESGELQQVLKAAGAGELVSSVPAASASDSAPVKADVPSV